MSAHPSPARTALAALGVAALLAAAPVTAASAATAHGQATGKHSTTSKVSKAAKAKKSKKAKKAQPRPFSGHGIVVSHSGSTVTVLARTLRTGKKVAQNQRVTLNVVRAAAMPADGSQVTVTGKVTGTGDATTYTGRTVAEHRTETHVYLGTVTAIDGSVLSVSKGETPSDDPAEADGGSFTVDTSTASVFVDGVPGTVAVGQSVAVLGSDDEDAVVAADVYAFSVAPSVVTGRASAVNGTVVTLSCEEDVTASVDLAGAALVVDGTANGTVDQVAAGSRVTVLGATDGAGVFTASLALVITPDNHGNGDHEDGSSDSTDGPDGTSGSGSEPGSESVSG